MYIFRILCKFLLQTMQVVLFKYHNSLREAIKTENNLLSYCAYASDIDFLHG